MKFKQLFIGISLAACLVAAGCEDAGMGQKGNTPADIVSNVLESQKKTGSYYAESTVRVYKNNHVTEDSASKEWYEATTGKRRFETKSNGQEALSVNDGSQVITYDKTNKSAFSMNITDDMGLNPLSQRDVLMNMIKKMQSTHKFEVIGEEKVLGMNTYHVKLTANTSSTLMGDMEFWVDSKTWFVLKSTFVNGDLKTESEYTRLDFSPKFAEDTFKLDIPKDIQVKPIEDLNPIKEVTLEEAERALGQPLLVFNDQHVTLTKVALHELKGEINRTEVEVEFYKDQVPSLSLSVFKKPADSDPGALGKEIKVRQTNGWYSAEIRALIWDEGGLRYSLLNENPDVTLDQLVEMVQSMKLSS